MPGPARYVPVPDNLTAPTPDPPAPEPLCLAVGGLPAVLCNKQIDLWLEAYMHALAEANADKAAIAALRLEVDRGRD